MKLCKAQTSGVMAMMLGAVLLIMLVGTGEARRRGGAQPLMRRDGTYTMPKMDPAQLEAAAKQAAEQIVMWGSQTIFQLKSAAQMKKQVNRLKATGGMTPDGKGVQIDDTMGKHIIANAVGGVFIMMNSPAVGRMKGAVKKLMGEEARQTRILSLYKQLMDAHGGQLGSKGPAQDPPGFWEGALKNPELASAHSKFISDIEALADSPLAKKAGASAEAYNEAMLKYATSESFPANPPANR